MSETRNGTHRGIFHAYRGDEARADFLTAPHGSISKKGGINDPVGTQRIAGPRRFTLDEIDSLYRANWLFQNVIDIPASDAVREWIDIHVVDALPKDLGPEILRKLKELKARAAFEDALRYERKYGDGFIAVGVDEKGTQNLAERLSESRVRDVIYLNAMSRRNVHDARLQEDPWSPEFGEFESYHIPPVFGTRLQLPASVTAANRWVHASRVIHFQTRKTETDAWGAPLIEALWDPILLMDNSAWSIAQMVYHLFFKVLKSGDMEKATTSDDVREITRRIEHDWNTLTVAVVGREDEVNILSPAGAASGGLGTIIDFLWDYVAGAARMPKSLIMGQQQGTITGASFDTINYYMAIARLQETHLRPEIEMLVRLILLADNTVGNDQIKDEDWNVVFQPLWRVDAKTDAEIRKIQAEIDRIYLEWGVYETEEVQERLVGMASVFDAAADRMDLAPGDLLRLETAVAEARRAALRAIVGGRT